MTDDLQSRAAVRQIVHDYGRAVLSDSRRVEGLLRDLAPAARRETFLLVQAVRLGLVEALLARSLPPDVLATRWVRLLQDDLAVTAEAAGWAVARWTEALASAGLADPPAATLDPPEPVRTKAAPVFPAPPQPPKIPVQSATEGETQSLAESSALRMRGESHRRRRAFAAAMRDLNVSLALSPNDAEALLSRGDVFRELRQMQRARADLDRSIALSPTARAFAARAVLHAETGSTESAQRDMAMACALDPERSTFREWWQHF